LDECSSNDEDFPASESEYEYDTDDEIDSDMSKASIHGNDCGKADGNWKAYGNSDPDVSRKPQILTNGLNSPVCKQPSSP
jgi:hypothetical protein